MASLVRLIPLGLLGAAAACLGLSACAHRTGSQAAVETRPSMYRPVAAIRQRIGPWRLLVRRDVFNGETECRLETRRVRLASGYAAFEVGDHADTQSAEVRFDGGPVVAETSLALEAAERGARLWGDAAGHVGTGRVVMALERLKAPAGWTRTVYVRVRPGAGVQAFDLRGLPEALSAAEARGCPAL